MTYTLAVATATPQVSVALHGPDGPAGAVVVRAGRRHGETLAPAIQSLTSLVGVSLHQLERVAVDTGPGLFTGLRVGVATAKALGSALDLPVVACSSLDILAHPHRHIGRPVASVVDARRGEVFWAVYEPVAGGMAARSDAAVAAPEVVAAELARNPGVLLTGDGARRYFADGAFDVAPAEYDHPLASVLAELAPSRPALWAEKVTPTYLRGADVRIGWEQR
ncbi:MAG TPA: tRNA (adenosine(37)-N6)-threonylcarbamoyltransferase complex dimerization subunit type 1 TsaB [Acidimicrobiales bacterium]|nr:tRNA (adenosine(37)-N6)-threonylcarbamoyltransferase complex dimerization subunit type 1 TsaB [Acidimicrobiales bacterium]